MKYQDLKVGMKAEKTRVITSEDVLTFAKLTGDFNPIHVDEEFAKNSMFHQRIAHGMLTASLFTQLLGEELPGFGAIYLGQNSKFTAPVFLNEEITAAVEITSLRDDKQIVEMKTTVVKKDGTVCVAGTAVLKVPN